MAYFNWTSQLATGIPLIDEQHMKLVDFVNQLNDAMKRGKGKDALGQILAELTKYAQYHFALEEKAFETYGYPAKAAHRKAHADLMAQVGDYVGRHAKGEVAMSVEMLGFLTTWVTEHIMKEDMLYVPFLKDKAL